MKWMILLSLISLPVTASIWLPHEKVIWTILKKAERTPQMIMELNHPSIEKMSIDRSYEFVSSNCHKKFLKIEGMTKISDMDTSREGCEFY